MIGNLQMSNVDIFATGPAEQSLWWEEISLKAMTLDIADFLDSSYSVASSGGPSSTPSSSKRKLRSTHPSLPSRQRKRPISHFEDLVSDSEEKEEDKDDEEEEEEDGEYGTGGVGSQGLEEMQTPTSRPSGDPISSASNLLPPLSQTPRTPSASGPPAKRRKSDSITSIAKQLADISQQNAASLASIQKQTELAKQQTELALAEMRAENAKERMANLELHKSNQEFMRQESRTNWELCAQNREMLQLLLAKIGVEPLATLPPIASPPVLQLQGQPSGSNLSNASFQSKSTRRPPLRPVCEDSPCPPLPTKDDVPDPNVESEREEVKEDNELQSGDDNTTVEIQAGINLSRDASEVEPGSDALSTEDQPAGFAP